MDSSPYKPTFELTRGETVETVHFGAIAVVDGQGNLASSYGSPQAVTFLRSSAKPFQILPFLEQGGRQYFDLSLRQIAVMCASHSGTDEHVRVLREIQDKVGVSESDLMCGIHPLSHQPTIDAMALRGEALTYNRHNCSGKHTGMLAFARMRGEPIANYIDPEHPIQQEIRHTFAEMCSLPENKIALGTDGCSAPNFAVPLYNAALAFARLCDPDSAQPALGLHRAEACRTVTHAMISNPDMVGGPQSFDTLLMQAVPGRLVCKGGAEGYQAIGLMPGALGPHSPALGITFKISDGDLKGHSRPAGDPYGHARPAVALEILRQLGVLSDAELKELQDFGPRFQIHNWRKLLVGQARPCFKLETASVSAVHTPQHWSS